MSCKCGKVMEPVKLSVPPYAKCGSCNIYKQVKEQ